jgi:hypothetical protein
VPYRPTPIANLGDEEAPQQPPKLTSYLYYALGGALVPVLIELLVNLTGLHGG